VSADEFLDGWALWEEHRPQSAEDWIAVARRCNSDPEFDPAKASPRFRGFCEFVAWIDSAKDGPA